MRRVSRRCHDDNVELTDGDRSATGPAEFFDLYRQQNVVQFPRRLFHAAVTRAGVDRVVEERSEVDDVNRCRQDSISVH